MSINCWTNPVNFSYQKKLPTLLQRSGGKAPNIPHCWVMCGMCGLRPSQFPSFPQQAPHFQALGGPDANDLKKHCRQTIAIRSNKWFYNVLQKSLGVPTCGVPDRVSPKTDRRTLCACAADACKRSSSNLMRWEVSMNHICLCHIQSYTYTIFRNTYIYIHTDTTCMLYMYIYIFIHIYK